MKKQIVCAVLSAVLASSGMAQSMPDRTVTAVKPAKRSTNPNRMICDRLEHTGSRIGGDSVCKTAAEWEEQRRQAQDLSERARTPAWKENNVLSVPPPR